MKEPMMGPVKIAASGLSLVLAAGAGFSAPGAAAQDAQVDARANVQAELQEWRDRDAVHRLLLAYGRTIDERDFDGFGALFTEDGEYGGNTGPQAIGEGMRRTFASNPLGLREPNFHVFFNETINVDGAGATASSMSFYVAPDDLGGYRIVMMASYDDELVKVGETWKFKRRTVKALTPNRP
jgi:hypothetical protein